MLYELSGEPHPGWMTNTGLAKSGSRMMLLVELLQALIGYMGIYLGSRNIAVPQQHLNDTQIGAMIQ